jgi:hypothetical protein
MVDKISKEQFEELEFSSMWDSHEEFNKLLEEMIGITAKRYVGYQYFDSDGNYVGDSNNSTIRDLLNNALIKVEDMIVY